MDKNESPIDEKGGETKNSTTGERGTETVREKQVDEDLTKLFQSIQDDPITREIGTGRNSSQLGKEEDSREGSSDRIPTLEELAGLTIDEVTESGELIVATRSKPPISDEDKRELVEHSVRRQIRRKDHTNEDASAETKPLELTPEELWKQEFARTIMTSPRVFSAPSSRGAYKYYMQRGLLASLLLAATATANSQVKSNLYSHHAQKRKGRGSDLANL